MLNLSEHKICDYFEALLYCSKLLEKQIIGKIFMCPVQSQLKTIKNNKIVSINKSCPDVTCIQLC